MSESIAHIANDGRIQAVSEHLQNTAKIAASCLQDCRLENAAFLSGLLHDFGKFSPRFQKYILQNNPALRGSVIHTFQGCQYVLKKYHESDDRYAQLSAEIIAYAIGAHHGLFDCVGSKREIGLKYRKDKTEIDYDESVSSFHDEVITSEKIKECFSRAKEEIQVKCEKLLSLFHEDSDCTFSIGLLTRLILSSVIEGDRRDTAEFMNKTVFVNWPQDMRPIWKERREYLEEKLLYLPSDSAIAKARREISDICSSSAELPCGIYRLNVPTGGGKTLSSLRYALAHAQKYNKKRIIFTSPLLSILEQNAAVIRSFIGDDSLILEHHSNIVREVREDREDSTQDKLDEHELDERELFIQTWDAPVIITTMVQLLNTIFDGKTSSIRRFQALCNSVIVIDEVQTVPAKMLTLFNLAIQFLSHICGATIVLCSATQPCLEKVQHPIGDSIPDLVPYDESLWRVFQRTKIVPSDTVREEDLLPVILKRMESTQSLLVICNKKGEASRLAQALKDCDWNVFHLSASMCIQHRRDTVDALKRSLESGRKTLCVSTQVIEAGVDISFQSVIRLTAGMDSVVQAAGRCNRNGEAEQVQPVYLVNIADETLSELPEISRGKSSTVALLNAYEQSPDYFDNDLASKAAIQFYYEHYYAEMNQNAQDFPLPNIKTSIFDLLSLNNKYADVNIENIENYFLYQAFKTAGKDFEVFDENSQEVIVPYGDGRELIARLCSSRALEDAVYRSELLKRARAFSVSIYQYQIDALQKDKAIYPVCKDYALALSEACYDPVLGLLNEPNVMKYQEV